MSIEHNTITWKLQDSTLGLGNDKPLKMKETISLNLKEVETSHIAVSNYVRDLFFVSALRYLHEKYEKNETDETLKEKIKNLILVDHLIYFLMCGVKYIVLQYLEYIEFSNKDTDPLTTDIYSTINRVYHNCYKKICYRNNADASWSDIGRKLIECENEIEQNSNIPPLYKYRMKIWLMKTMINKYVAKNSKIQGIKPLEPFIIRIEPFAFENTCSTLKEEITEIIKIISRIENIDKIVAQLEEISKINYDDYEVFKVFLNRYFPKDENNGSCFSLTQLDNKKIIYCFSTAYDSIDRDIQTLWNPEDYKKDKDYKEVCDCIKVFAKQIKDDNREVARTTKNVECYIPNHNKRIILKDIVEDIKNGLTKNEITKKDVENYQRFFSCCERKTFANSNFKNSHSFKMFVRNKPCGFCIPIVGKVLKNKSKSILLYKEKDNIVNFCEIELNNLIHQINNAKKRYNDITRGDGDFMNKLVQNLVNSSDNHPTQQ